MVAEMERQFIRERQQAGIEKAKKAGVYKGRKPSIDPAEVRRLREAEGLGPSAIARRLVSTAEEYWSARRRKIGAAGGLAAWAW